MDIDQITVALATYRRPSGLHDAIESLASQNFKRLRVLVSDDDPNEINLQRVTSEKRLEIEYLPQAERKGVLHNHLSMISRVQSDMFMFHGDDDRLLPNALTALSELLKATRNYHAIFANYRMGSDSQHTRHVSISNLPFARYWRHHRRTVRLLAYYLCPTFLGKQNIYYALYRTDSIHKINLDKALPPRNHLLNLDEMYSFQAVCNGPILVINDECYYFADGNNKFYTDGSQSSSNKFASLMKLIKYELVTFFDYQRNVDDAMSKALLVVLFPIKVSLAVLWRFKIYIEKKYPHAIDH